MIQIDMKMPECCDDCPMLDEYGDYPMCRITQETRGYTFNTRKKRMDKCPMKPMEAVPLDKLCEWLAEHYGSPCQLAEIDPYPQCEPDENGECYGMRTDDKKCWHDYLTKWMEGLDAEVH